MIKLLTNHFNIIIKFLVKINDHNITILLKFNCDNKLIKINIINVINYTQFLLFIKKKLQRILTND